MITGDPVGLRVGEAMDRLRSALRRLENGG
jgi:hypothetical protein